MRLHHVKNPHFPPFFVIYLGDMNDQIQSCLVSIFCSCMLPLLDLVFTHLFLSCPANLSQLLVNH